MGFFDKVKDSIASSAGGMLASGIGAIGNIGGSAAQSALGMYTSKKMAKYNYNLQKKGYLEFPTAQVEGLKAAGINPMVAYGGISGATAHSGNYAAAPGSNLGSSALSDYRESRKLDPTVENVKADTAMKNKQGDAATAQAKLLNAQADKVEKETPGTTVWGTVDRIIKSLGSVGASAFGVKGLMDWLSGKGKTSKPSIKVPAIKSAKTAATKVVKSKPTVVSSGKSAAKVVSALKSIAPVAAAAGAVYGTKKLGDAYDKSKNAKKMKDRMHIWSHGNWSR